MKNRNSDLSVARVEITRSNHDDVMDLTGHGFHHFGGERCWCSGSSVCGHSGDFW